MRWPWILIVLTCFLVPSLQSAVYCDYSWDCSHYWERCVNHRCIPDEGRCYTDSDCEDWEECNIVNYCKVKKGRCEQDNDCAHYEYCNTSVHRCELEPGRCKDDDDCEQNEDCSYHSCVLKPGMCNEDSDCYKGEKCYYGKCKPEDYCEDDFECEYGLCEDNSCVAEKFYEGSESYVIIIFDNSRSMADITRLNETRKIDIAKKAVPRMLNGIKNTNTYFSLIIFDHCSPKLFVNFTKSRTDIMNAIKTLRPGEATPLANSLEYAYKIANKTSLPVTIVLFTDGEEYCGGDPCGIVKEYKNLENRSTIPVYTIGYMVGDRAEQQLKCIAHESHGQYFHSPSLDVTEEVFEELSETLAKKCKDNDDCTVRTACINGRCVPSKISFVFVPINQHSSQLEAYVKKLMEGFIEYMELKNCSNLVRYEIVKHRCHIVKPDNDSEVIPKIRKSARAAGLSTYDFLIGVTPPDGIEGAVIGFSITNTPYVIIEAERAHHRSSLHYASLLAHEIGHKFGLSDQYCSCPPYCNVEPNPLMKEYGCDPEPGKGCCWTDEKFFIFTLRDYCVLPKNYRGCEICCLGNKNDKGGRSIMSYLDAPGPRAFDKPSLEHLKKFGMLRCD